ncbi:MAG: quinone-dependent dihydroorotate dehydrogenase [Sphingomonadales bacterium]
MTLFDIARPLLFRIDAERAHRMTVAALRYAPPRTPTYDPTLAIRVAGVDFPSPIGLAAGFDKNAEVPDAVLGLGFGFAEVGSLTPLPQDGNPKPRVFRLAEDEGVINRMGFNNDGLGAAHARLARRRRKGIVGVNVGANKDAADRVADYVTGIRGMADVADYLTVNISSPNTPGLRGLQDAGALLEVLDRLGAARRAGDPPLFLKLAPDLDNKEIDAVARVVVGRVDALIIGNTTLLRPDLRSQHASESGGLSGVPLRHHAHDRLCAFRRATGGEIPLIAAGGIDSADEAYHRIRAGASLVQLYSALVYHGPGLARTIAKGLTEHLRCDGFACVADAVGVDL